MGVKIIDDIEVIELSLDPEPNAFEQAYREAQGCDACEVVGPLLVAPGTSGRIWVCACGKEWKPQ